MSTNIITAYHMLLKKTLSDVIYPNVSVLPGLLLQVVLVVHGVLIWSDMLKTEKTLISTNIITAYHILVEQIQT